MKRVIAAAALCASLVAVASAHSTPNLDIGQCRIQVQQLQLADFTRETLGSACMLFKHRTKTKAFMRAYLEGNGFESVGIPPVSSRHFRFRALTKDDTQVVGVGVKTGKRQLVLKMWFAAGPRPVRTSTVTTPFEA